MSILPPSNTSLKARGPTGWQAANAEIARIAAEQAARDADPVERAVRYLRSRGRVIFRASVHGGPADRWKLSSGKLLTAAEVISLAEQLEGITAAARVTPPPAAAEAPDQIRWPLPTLPAAPSSPASTFTPAAHATAQPQEPPMGHHFKAKSEEEINCEERGTTPERVKAELSALKDAVGASELAMLLKVGKSSIGNIIGGHAVVGPTILNALYGQAGCTLKPGLASMLKVANAGAAVLAGAADAPEVPVSATSDAPAKIESNVRLEPAPTPLSADQERKADVARMWGQPVDGEPAAPAVEPPATDLALGLFTGGPLTVGETREWTVPVLEIAPELAPITVADMLAAVRGRRAALVQELADIDQQVRAVLKLAGMAA